MSRFGLLFPFCLLLPMVASGQQALVQSIRQVDSRTVIAGTWPNGCTPKLMIWSHGARGELDVLLGDGPGQCAPGEHAFEVSLPRGTFSPPPDPEAALPLRVFVEDEQGIPALGAFALQAGRAGKAMPDSGFWWPQGTVYGSGNLLSLERQGDTLGIALLSHDDLDGTPVWYFGTSQIVHGTAHASLTRLDDGASPFFELVAPPQPRAALTIDISFESSNHAQVWLSRPSPVQSGNLELVALQFARRSFSSKPLQQRWQGHWLVAHDSTDPHTDWPRTLDLQAVSGHAYSGPLQWVDENADLRLRCALAPGGAGLARSCVLVAGDGELRARFGRIAQDRLDGQDSQGRRVSLLRVQ